MRNFNIGRFPVKPWLALATSEFVGEKAPICWADFKDTHALFLPEAGRFVGVNQEGLLILGSEAVIMVDGLWVLQEDLDIAAKYPDIPALKLELSIIK